MYENENLRNYADLNKNRAWTDVKSLDLSRALQEVPSEKTLWNIASILATVMN